MMNLEENVKKAGKEQKSVYSENKKEKEERLVEEDPLDGYLESIK